MANAAGGGRYAQHGSRLTAPYGGQGQYYQQQSHPHMVHQYYPQHVSATAHHPSYPSQATHPVRAPPPPPPPPPGETPAAKTSAAATIPVTSGTAPAGSFGGYVPPLLPPPLPPMFPWMSQSLAESMTSSQFGKTFKEEAKDLPFVPIIVNDSDLAKMTEKIIKEAEEVKTQQLQYYKEVMQQDLPQSLKDMFQPLYCKLCVLTLSSPVVAKDHYNGKRHKKAIEGWMSQNPHIVKIFNNSKGPGFPGSKHILDGPLNGFITKVQNSLPAPSSAQQKPLPFFDRKRPGSDNMGSANNNFNHAPMQGEGGSRFPRPLLNTPNNSNARGGNNFNIRNNFPNYTPELKRPRKDEPPPKTEPGGLFPKGSMCTICNVQLTSQVMAEQHFKGKNHATKLAALNEQPDSSSSSSNTPAPAPNSELPGNSTTERLLALSSSATVSHLPSGGVASHQPFQTQKPPMQSGPRPGFVPRGAGPGFPKAMVNSNNYRNSNNSTNANRNNNRFNNNRKNSGPRF